MRRVVIPSDVVFLPGREGRTGNWLKHQLASVVLLANISCSFSPLAGSEALYDTDKRNDNRQRGHNDELKKGVRSFVCRAK